MKPWVDQELLPICPNPAVSLVQASGEIRSHQSPLEYPQRGAGPCQSSPGIPREERWPFYPSLQIYPLSDEGILFSQRSLKATARPLSCLTCPSQLQIRNVTVKSPCHLESLRSICQKKSFSYTLYNSREVVA